MNRSRGIVSILILLVFFAWIIPLGFFIKPSQEVEFCSGRRAICLCTHLINKAQPKQKVIQKIRSGDRVGASQTTSPNFGSDFVFFFQKSMTRSENDKSLVLTFDSLTKIYPQGIEHVPKV